MEAIYVITTFSRDLRAFGEPYGSVFDENGSATAGAYIPFDEFYRRTVVGIVPTVTVVQGALRIYDPGDRTRGDRIILVLNREGP